MNHQWQRGRFTDTRTCTYCGLLPLDADDETSECATDAPVDSDTFPVAVLLQGDDLDESYCDECGRPAEDWPRGNAIGGDRPGAMYQAALYCSIDMPFSFDPHTGNRVDTETGD